VYPLPRISDILSKLEGAEYFSIMDLQSGYHQLPLRKEDREKTAFITADGLYHFKVLPFGLSNGLHVWYIWMMSWYTHLLLKLIYSAFMRFYPAWAKRD
jgi:putative transposase